MSKEKEKATNSTHIDEFHPLDKEFDSVLNVIRRSNIDPHKFCPKRIIGEIDDSASQFNSTQEFEKHVTEICSKEINEGSINFDFDLISKCHKEIINDNHGSINFDKAALLVQSSAQVYSKKVDNLHSLISQASETIKKKDQPEQQKYVSEQTEEEDDDDDSWVPNHMEVDPNFTLDDTATSSINLVKPPADLVLEGEGLDAAGDGEGLQSSADSPLTKTSENQKGTELDAHVSLWKQQIKQDLKEQKARPVFDINDYGERVLHKLSQSADLKNTVAFADVVQGEEKHDVARSFSALLHLANNGNIDLQKSDTNDGESMSAEPFSVRLLRHVKRRQEVEFQPSKRRAVSQTNEGESKDKIGGSGKENREPLISTPTSANDNSPLSD